MIIISSDFLRLKTQFVFIHLRKKSFLTILRRCAVKVLEKYDVLLFGIFFILFISLDKYAHIP